MSAETEKPEKPEKPTARAGPAGTVRPLGALLRLGSVQLLRTKRVLLLVATLAVPVVVLFAYAVGAKIEQPIEDLWPRVFVVAWLHFVIPFVALFGATTIMLSDREDGSVTYLFTRPVSRAMILSTKYLSAALVTGAGVLLSLALGYAVLAFRFDVEVLAGNFAQWLWLFCVAVIALLVYGAIFVFVGMRFRRPVVVGFIFIVLWETFVGYIPAGIIHYVTVVHHLRSLVLWKYEGIVPDLVGIKPVSAGTAFAVLAALWMIFVALSLWWFSRSEFRTKTEGQ